jgi:hypothetical protein
VSWDISCSEDTLCVHAVFLSYSFLEPRAQAEHFTETSGARRYGISEVKYPRVSEMRWESRRELEVERSKVHEVTVKV